MENIDIDKLTPMMKIYCETKEQYKDCILFYRLGDFYEMFFDDAWASVHHCGDESSVG